MKGKAEEKREMKDREKRNTNKEDWRGREEINKEAEQKKIKGKKRNREKDE